MVTYDPKGLIVHKDIDELTHYEGEDGHTTEKDEGTNHSFKGGHWRKVSITNCRQGGQSPIEHLD
jgi:hypothetical protein